MVAEEVYSPGKFDESAEDYYSCVAAGRWSLWLRLNAL